MVMSSIQRLRVSFFSLKFFAVVPVGLPPLFGVEVVEFELLLSSVTLEIAVPTLVKVILLGTLLFSFLLFKNS